MKSSKTKSELYLRPSTDTAGKKTKAIDFSSELLATNHLT